MKSCRDFDTPTGSSFSMPSVTSVSVDFSVTGLTQCNEIISCVCATLRERQDVMNFFCRCQPTFFLTKFTYRMHRHIAISYSFPSSAVSFTNFRGSVIGLIAFGFSLLMFLTEPSVSKPRTAGIRTRTLWFLRHFIHLQSGIRKASQERGAPTRLYRVCFFAIIMIT